MSPMRLYVSRNRLTGRGIVFVAYDGDAEAVPLAVFETWRTALTFALWMVGRR